MEETLLEFAELVKDRNGIRLISYDPTSDTWIIHYKNNIPSNEIETEDLLDFIQNG